MWRKLPSPALLCVAQAGSLRHMTKPDGNPLSLDRRKGRGEEFVKKIPVYVW
jgi:hypothetical protein